MRQDPALRQGVDKDVRLARSLRGRRSCGGQGIPGGRSRHEWCGQDYFAQAARRGGAHRRGGWRRLRPWPQDWLLCPGARHDRRLQVGVGKHDRGLPRRWPTGPAWAAWCLHVLRRQARSAGGHPFWRREDSPSAGDAGFLACERVASRRAHQQPRPTIPRTGPRCAEDVHGSGGAGHPRSGCGAGARARAGHHHAGGR